MFERVLRLPRPQHLQRREQQEREEEQIQVRLSQECEGDESVVVWDAALVLAHFLQHKSSSIPAEQGQGDNSGKGGIFDLRGKKVLELGAGTGAVGIVAAILGADVTLTDLETCLPLLKKNSILNKEHLDNNQTIEARKLDWGADQDLNLLISERGPFDLVLVSDCVYYQDSLEPLVQTLVKVGATVLLSYEERYSEEKVKVQRRFFELISKAGFKVHEYPTSECHPEYASPDIHVLRLDHPRSA